MIICPEIASAKKGNFLDEYYLARAYDKGYCGVIQNKKRAEDWYLKAAGHGHMLAAYQLGEKHFTGEGVSVDYPKAKKWYLAAAQQGHGPSQLRLGFLYAEGHFKGLKTDYVEAETWFLKAAENDAGDARFRLGNFYRNYKHPPEPEKALRWLMLAADGGHRVAMFDLARMLKNGEGTEKNPEQALVWLQKSAELDLLSAQITLSRMYAAGDGVPKAPLQSLLWTLKIAMKPDANPYWINRAGDIFFEGCETIPKDPLQAVKYYERTAAQDDPHALMRLGRIYGVDTPKGKEYLEKAAAKGSEEAKSLLKGPPNALPSQK